MWNFTENYFAGLGASEKYRTLEMGQFFSLTVLPLKALDGNEELLLTITVPFFTVVFQSL